MEVNKIYCGDSKELIKQLPDKSINCAVTSPPYWGLRDYGKSQQLGLEETPEQYVQNLVEIFREVRRALADDGTLWLNIGDSYCSTAPGSYSAPLRQEGILSGVKESTANARKTYRPNTPFEMKPKDLVGIPFMVAFALRADGWYLRQDIIWHKPNPMPESVTDRCTKAHEYIFLLSKSQKYYYDHKAIMTNSIDADGDRKRFERQSWDNKNTPDELRNGIRPRRSGNKERKSGAERGCPENNGSHVCGSVPWEGDKANKRSVWTVNTKPFSGAHFATFPQELIIDCIKAGCPENGIVLDPFMGAGTTALVANKLNRNYIGFELNEEYVKLANKRLSDELGFFYRSSNELKPLQLTIA